MNKFIKIASSAFLTFVVVGIAYADIIHNNVDATVDTTIEELNLTVGANGNVSYIVVTQERDVDGDNACNIEGHEVYTLSVNTSNSSVATVNPTSITFQPGCGSQAITVNSIGAGTANITLSQVTNTTGGTFDLSNSAFIVNVTAPAPTDSTPPEITLTLNPEPNENGWNNEPVQVIWDINDGESDFDIIEGCVDQTLSADTSGTEVTCVVESDGGESDESATVRIDTSAPLITSSVPTPNDYGWYNTNVLVDFSCTETGTVQSGIDEGVSDVTLTASDSEQSALSGEGDCTDEAGNTAEPVTVSGINIDKVKPVITGEASPEATPSGWNNTDVEVSFSCSDALSGVDPEDDTVAGETLTDEVVDEDVTDTGTCTDMAGNVADSATVEDISIDKTKPVITGAVSRVPDFNGWYTSPVDVEFSCADTGLVMSGIDESETNVDEDDETLSDGVNQSVSSDGDCFDEAGNEALTPVAVTNINVDTTGPVLTGVRTPLANGYGWNNSAVTVSFNCADPVSGVATNNAVGGVASGEGAGQSVTSTGDCTNNAGLTSTPVTVEDINIDLTAPEITGTPEHDPDHNGWYNQDVNIEFSCTDALSDVDPLLTTLVDVLLETDGIDIDVPSVGECVDQAGNSATPYIVQDLDMDQTAPEIVITTPANSGSYTYNQVVLADWEITDATSGVDTDSIEADADDGSPINTSSMGVKEFSVSASDLAGNSATLPTPHTYTVVPYDFENCLAPLTLNSKDFKKMSTIPVKCVYNTTTGDPVTNATIELYTGATGSTPAVSSGGSNDGNDFRYSPVGEFWIFNLSTKSLVIGNNLLTIKSNDGEEETITIKVK
jgi:hypothetical protein